MKTLLLPLLTAAAAAGLAAPTWAAIGTGDGRIEVYATDAGRNWQHSGMTSAATWGSVRFAQIVSENDPSIGAVRFMGSNITWQRHDNNTQLSEKVDIFSLNGDPETLGLPAEVGEVLVPVPTFESTYALQFERTYTDPVVFAMVKQRTGSQPITARAANVTPTGADIVLTEPASWDGYHYNEQVHYLVIEAGVHSLPDGRVIEVGTAQDHTAARGYRYGPSVTLQQPTYGPSVVITTIQNSSRAGYMGTRVRHPSPGHDLHTGFDIRFAHELDGDCLEGAEACYSGPRTNYTIGYLSYGTPWTDGPGRISFYDDDDDLIGGYDVRTRPRGVCIDFDGTSIDGQNLVILGAATEGSTIKILPYRELGCVNLDPRSTPTVSTTEVSYLHWGGTDLRSVRVLYAAKATTTERRSWGEGEPIVQSELASLMVQDGELRLYRTLPADGLLWEAWSTDLGNITEARFEADGRFTLYNAAGNRRYATGAGGGVVSVDVLNNCHVQTTRNSGGIKTLIGFGDCDPESTPPRGGLQAMPDLQVSFADLDGDGDNELLLDVHNPAGNGVLMYDPLGIIDLLGTYRVPLPDDLWNLLSQTQRAALMMQIPEEMGYGATIERDEAEELRVAWQWSAIIRPWDVIHYNSRSEGSAAEVGVDTPIPTTRIELRAGNYRYEVDRDEYGTGFIFEASLIQIEYSALDGMVTLTATGPAAGYAIDLDDNGFTLGAQAQVAGVAFGAGDPDGTNIGMNADVGQGFWLDGAFGRDGQYGYAIQVPVIPVGVAVYIHADDARMVADFAEDWGLRGVQTSAELSEWAWSESSDWILAHDGDMVLRFEDTMQDARITAQRFSENGEAKLRMAVGETSDGVISVFDAAEGALDDIADGLDATGDALAHGVEQMMSTVDDWANQAGDFAAETTGDAINGAKKIYKKLKFW